MIKNILYLIIINTLSIFSQTIIWESEYNVSEYTGAIFTSIVKDSESNYACVFNDMTPPYNQMNIIKLNPYGKLLKFNVLSRPYGICPVNILETKSGYRIFNGAWNVANSMFTNKLPMIVNLDLNGELINEYLPYDVNDKSLYEYYSYDQNWFSNNLINIGNKYYTCFVKSEIPTGENSYRMKDHIILTSYDSIGVKTWRYGIDTSNKAENGFLYNYVFCRLSSTFKHNILAVYQTYIGDSNYKQYILIEFDTLGNILNKWEFEHEEQGILVHGLSQLADGSMIILGQYKKMDDIDNPKVGLTLLKINDKGEKIKILDVPYRNYYDYETHLLSMPDGGFLLYGTDIYFSNNTTGTKDDSLRSYIRKYNSDFETVYDFGWMEHCNDSTTGISNIYILDYDNLIVTGYKNRNNFYIAQLNTANTDVKELPNNNVIVSVHPQPFRDICEITVENAGGQYLTVNLYDALSNKVMNLCDETAQSDRKSFLLNGRSLVPGAYFVEVKAGKEMIREKLLKAE
jgi:hypothetical protein